VAIRITRHVRPLLALIAVAATIAVAPSLASAAPQTAPHAKPAKPTVSSVQKQLAGLAHQNTQLVEKFNQAKIAVTKREHAAGAAQTAALRANTAYNTAHEQFIVMIQAQYETSSFGAAGALLDSSSDSNYLDRLQTLDMISTHTAEVVNEVAQARASAATAAHTAQQLLVTARDDRDALAKKRKSIQGQITKYQRLLASLTAAQQAAFERQQNPTVKTTAIHPTKAPTAAAQKAVDFAMSQLGKPYSWGADGPGSYDCSGLTMQAWAHAGVSLPHSAADQYNYGHHVSRSELQPGDLIFFYSPIGHVTIYIGHGQMVSAPEDGEDVSVVPLDGASDYVGATRLTG
jgi:cell wall-associated NlpC family hydrolase